MKLTKKVIDIELSKTKTFSDLAEQMHSSGGFVAKKLGVSVNILAEMFKDRECVKFLSFPSCLVATGTRGVLKDLVKEKLVDVVITTCGTLDHDLARVWKDYYHGEFEMDDAELHKQGINREGNVLIPNECYGEILEDKVQPFLKELWNSGKKEFSTKELVWAFGETLNKEKNRESSITYWAWKNHISVFIPGITDGAFGYQLWFFYQTHKDFKIDLLKDEQELERITHNAKRTGALIIGGGISKHHTIWWNQFRGGLDYAVYITTANEWDGSLSGAKMREAISWGKLKENAKHVTIEADATAVLPFMIGAVKEGLK